MRTLVPSCNISCHPLIGAGFLKGYINQNVVAAQARECFVPWLPHPTAGQRPVVSFAMHEPFQRLGPSLPFQLPLHGTSTNVPSIAPRPLGKNAVPVPESWHRSKLWFGLFQHATVLMGKARNDALHGHAKLVKGMGDRLATPLLIAINRAQIVSPHNDAIERARV